MEHRIMTIRISGTKYDISIKPAYAPGEHAAITERTKFWNYLNKTIAKLPHRTYKITGIDANGHIGRDPPEPYVGKCGMTRWNTNGTALANLAQATKLTTTNTMPTCKESTWTWQHRDGHSRTKIDYILIPTFGTSQIINNTGAMNWQEIAKQGTSIDHRPVGLQLRIETLHCRMQNNKINKQKDAIN